MSVLILLFKRITHNYQERFSGQLVIAGFKVLRSSEASSSRILIGVKFLAVNNWHPLRGKISRDAHKLIKRPGHWRDQVYGKVSTCPPYILKYVYLFYFFEGTLNVFISTSNFKK